MNATTSIDRILPRALLFVLPPTFIVLVCVAIAASSTVWSTATSELDKRLSRSADQSALSLSAKFRTIIDAATGLAANDLVVNSIVDDETRSNYIPLLFGSLRIPGPLGARISLADYRGRLIATNEVETIKTVQSRENRVEFIKAGLSFRISKDGLIVAVPVLYGGQSEGLVLVEYGPESLPDLIEAPVGGHEMALKNRAGELIYATHPDLAADGGAPDTWIVNTQSLPGFSSLHLAVGEPRNTAFAAVVRQGHFLLVAITISFLAVVLGIIATAYLVKRPLMSAIDQVNEANKTKSLFLASMSHEIRTPMNGVLGMATLMNDGTLTPEQRDRVQTIQSSGETLMSLLNDILDLSKIEAGHLDLEIIDFELPRIVEEVRNLWEPQTTAKGLSFNCIYDRDALSPLRSDPTRVKQILFNFISNAQKFTEDGEIALRVSQKPLTGDRIETRFEVHDTGIGIDAAKQQHLFESFKQADNSITRRYGGTGLGLAISKKLAEAMGGTIGIDSAAGSGSCFWFTTVSPTGEIQNTGDASLAENSAPAGGDRILRILIAEDNKVNQAVIRAILERPGHRLDTVGNGLEAVAAVIRAPYDLVLMDVQMPEMDGMTATRRIRDIQGDAARIPIIALTANAMKGDRELYLDAGMDDYVSKPIDPVALFAAMRRTCGPDVAALYQAAPKSSPASIPASTTTPANVAAADREIMNDLDDLLGEMDKLSG